VLTVAVLTLCGIANIIHPLVGLNPSDVQHVVLSVGLVIAILLPPIENH
jgi:hypothetical protein